MLLKNKIIATLFMVGVIAMTLFSQRHALACELVSYSNYRHETTVSSNLYFSPSIDKRDRAELLAVFEEGRRRVSETFGQTTSTPDVVVTATKSEAASFGSNVYGRAFLTPIGQCLVLGPEGLNTDVIAHEYLHAEVHHRVGWFNHFTQIPIWFNEGVSLLVDFREPYLLENIDLTQADVDAIQATGSDFFTGNDVVKNYQAARVAVERLDRKKLYEKLQRIRGGERFDQAFDL